MRFLPLTFFIALMGSLTVGAHPNLQDAMRVQWELSLIRVTVNVSAKEISVAQGVLVGNGDGPETEAWQTAAEIHGDYLLQHLHLSAGTNILVGRAVKLLPPPQFDEPENTFYQYELEYALTGSPPAELTFFQDMLVEWPYAAGIAWNVSYVVRFSRAGSAADTSRLLAHQQRTTFPTGWAVAGSSAAPAAQSDGWRNFRDYLRHGVLHILTGYDHLLFVAALVLATMSFWEMVKVIAAFTCAHTLTLALSVFDIFRLPAFVVEPVISLSIVFVAVENIFWPQRAHSRVRLAVAFGFGLIHGLGFAGGLLDAMAGLPSVGIWIALVAFSLGVEIGHQVVVLPLFGLLKLNRCRVEERFHATSLRCGSAVIACGGAYYLFAALHAQVFSR